MRLGLVAAMLLAASGASPARAADGDGLYTAIGGPALATCGQWLELQGSGDVREEQVNAWIAGFVSAYNLYGHPGRNVLVGRDPGQLLRWTGLFCRANPDATMTVTAESMIQSLLAAGEPK